MTLKNYTTKNKSIHLPYEIDPSKNRFHYYETLWKEIALRLLSLHEPNLKGLSLFDYGCGRGETMMLARSMGMNVSGTDLDPECIRMSSVYGRTELLNLADPVGQFGSQAFDIVSAFHVLEHVPCPVDTLTNESVLEGTIHAA
jgi:2-polyprenyl-3-methyl-5-hydroxy-6-metoxy-1,4-benzoquinol methylase